MPGLLAQAIAPEANFGAASSFSKLEAPCAAQSQAEKVHWVQGGVQNQLLSSKLGRRASGCFKAYKSSEHVGLRASAAPGQHHRSAGALFEASHGGCMIYRLAGFRAYCMAVFGSNFHIQHLDLDQASLEGIRGHLEGMTRSTCHRCNETLGGNSLDV